MSTYLFTRATLQTPAQQSQPSAIPGIWLGKPRHGRRPAAPHNHGSMHTEGLCAEELLKTEAKMPPGAQEDWNEADSTWTKGQPCLGECMGDGFSTKSLAGRRSKSTSLAQLHFTASCYQTLLARAAQPARHGRWLFAIRCRRQQLKFCFSIRSPLEMLGK